MRYFLFVCALIFTTTTFSQETTDNENLKIFVDCRADCDLQYIRTKIAYVDYVRDQGLADIHVLINSISTGSGGRQFTLQFIKQGDFSEAPIQELIFNIQPNATSDDIRNAMTKKIALGLVPFLINTPIADQLTITGPEMVAEKAEEKAQAQAEFDPWNYWVFDLSFRVNADLQSAQRRTDLRSDLDISRITNDWRITNFIYYRSTRQRFIQDEGDLIRTRTRYGIFGRTVRSINDHWSVGAFHSVFHNTFENIDASIRVGPAIEYSIFPYEEAIYREFTIAYFNRAYYRDYIEETIFGKTDEYLWEQELQIALRLRKPWGNIFSQLSGSHFMNDFSKNRLEFRNNIDVRLTKGLALRISSEINLINDQLSLPRGEISLEDLLLAQRAQATDFEASFSVGFNYTFGSIYNNIINPRL